MFEVEKKFQVSDLDHYRQSISQLLGDVVARIEEQTDWYMAHPCRDFQQTDEACRIRNLNGRFHLTYKGPKTGGSAKTRQEVEVQLGIDPEEAKRLLELFSKLGFQSVRTVTKRREEYDAQWHGKKISIALDEVESLGKFVEIESVVDEANVSQAELIVNDLADRMQLENSITTSYMEMLMSQDSNES